MSICDNGERMPGLRDIWRARQRIAGFVRKTPLIFSAELSRCLNASVYLKLEFMQDTGSFKLRGAANKILSLPPEQQKAGVATFSTGNHGLAVAYMAKSLGIPASVFISSRVPAAKVNNLKTLGVNVVIYGTSQDEAEENCYETAERDGLTVVKPFDDLYVIAGQGTIGLELLDECPSVNHVIVPLSGGGLAAGIAVALKSGMGDIRVTGVSMREGAGMHSSLRAGKPVALPEADTLADSLLGGIGLDNRYTFPLVRDYLDDTVLVSEEAIAAGMALLYREHRLVVEGAAAIGAAFLLEHGNVLPGRHVVLVVSGSNVDTDAFLAVLQNRS